MSESFQALPSTGLHALALRRSFLRCQSSTSSIFSILAQVPQDEYMTGRLLCASDRTQTMSNIDTIRWSLIRDREAWQREGSGNVKVEFDVPEHRSPDHVHARHIWPENLSSCFLIAACTSTVVLMFKGPMVLLSISRRGPSVCRPHSAVSRSSPEYKQPAPSARREDEDFC